jgi:hypothetical protein
MVHDLRDQPCCALGCLQVVDEKPPRATGDERTTLTGLLEYQRKSLVKKLTSVDDDGATFSPVPSGTSLLWLANHMADAETTWVLQRFAGRPERDVVTEHAGTLERAIHRYQAVWDEVNPVVAMSPLNAPCLAADLEPIPDLRWILAHLLEETARHAGHADILRELIDGSTGR